MSILHLFWSHFIPSADAHRIRNIVYRSNELHLRSLSILEREIKTDSSSEMAFKLRIYIPSQEFSFNEESWL